MVWDLEFNIEWKSEIKRKTEVPEFYGYMYFKNSVMENLDPFIKLSFSVIL